MIKGTKELLIIFALLLIIGMFMGGIIVNCNKPKEPTKTIKDETIKDRIDSSDNDELRSIIDSTITD